MRPLKIMLGDLSYDNKYNGWMQVVPINIGYIGQYIKQEFGDEIEVDLFKTPSEFLEIAKQSKPDIVGLSLYYWNTDLNRSVVQNIRSMYGNEVIIAHGGPSTDTETHEQKNYLNKTHGVDALILEEGEIPFSEIVNRRLSNKDIFNKPIDGALFLEEDNLICGENRTVQTDLAKINSPYKSGILDKFIFSDHLPMIQMSRYCPYTCSFCVSGKTRGKLRAFPMDMIKEEISYIADVYADRPHFALQVTDENFGILKRDLEIAEHIRKVSDEKRYPRQMFYYSDKRFSETARGIVETLGDINTMGFQISLQSGNKKTLEAVKRKNLSEEDVKNAIEWASEKNIDTFTELIFGMPNETLDSFCDTLDDSSKRGFDSIQSYSLFLMAGIPLNTLENRKKYDIKTKLRLLSSSYAEIEGDFSVEHEEIVTATNTLSEQDFKSFRKISFMYYVVFRLSYYKHFFSFIQSLDISLSRFFKDFMDPDLAEEWPEDYIKFISDFNKESEDELFDNRESLIKRTKNNFRKNGNEVDKPTRLNPYFGARLVYIESVWIRGVLVKHLNKFENFNKSKIYKYLLNLVLDISENERIDIRNPKNNNVVLETKFDVIEWKKQKFIKPLNQFPIEEKTIYFNFSKNALDIIDGFANEYKNQEDPDFYYNAIDFILPRSNQLYDISYSMEKVKEAKNTTERLYENERIPV